MKRPVIGYVTTGLTGRGGMDRFSKGMMEAMSVRADVAGVTVLTSAGAKNDTQIKHLYAELPDETSYGLREQWQIFRACMRRLRSCDVIHCVIEPFGPGAALASLILRKRFVLTIAATYAVPPRGLSPRAIVKRAMMRFMYRRAACVASGSRGTIERIEEVFPVPNWQFVPFGADYAHFSSRNSVPSPARPFLLTVGGVKPRKGADMVIRALAKLTEFPELEYRIVGSVDKFQKYVDELKRLAREQGVADRVHFLGRVSDEELLTLYAQCRMFVLAAQTREGSFEGFPMVFYEAHAGGAPIVSTNGFGSEYVVKDGYNGYLVPQDNAEALADAIRKIHGSDVLRAQMSENARREAQKHDWPHIAERYAQIYARI